jgi:hypothetical protein
MPMPRQKPNKAPLHTTCFSILVPSPALFNLFCTLKILWDKDDGTTFSSVRHWERSDMSHSDEDKELPEC